REDQLTYLMLAFKSYVVDERGRTDEVLPILVAEDVERRICQVFRSANAWRAESKEENYGKQSQSLRAAIHPMLIVFPLGLLETSLIFDIIHWITGNGFFSVVAF